MACTFGVSPSSLQASPAFTVRVNQNRLQPAASPLVSKLPLDSENGVRVVQKQHLYSRKAETALVGTSNLSHPL
jgi:hypothetical protein